MKISFSAVAAAVLLLSDSALAAVEKVAVDGCEADSNLSPTVAANDASASNAAGILIELDNNAAQSNPVVVITVTIIPLPQNSPSGISYPGVLPGTGTGTGYAYPTSHHHHHHKNGTGYSTRPKSTSSRNSTAMSTPSSVPFFTIQNTASLPLPTNSSSSIPFFTLQNTASVLLPTTSSSSATPISIQKSTVSTLTAIIIPPTISPAVPTTTSKVTDPIANAKGSPSPSSSSSTATSTTSSSSSFSSSATPAAAISTTIPFLRGVNLGGWLVLESWMDGDLFSGNFASAVDQYTFDQIPGAKAALENHWSTFFVESDISELASAGINALRIPIGYWAYDNSGTPYITGADAYLETAIGWARTYNMKVWVDCHGSPGSQNGFDNSGQKGVNEWQTAANLAKSISVLKTMAQKYGAAEYADVVVGLEMTNEPISYGNNLFSTTKTWAAEAYAAVKAVTENKNLVIVMHDAFQTPLAWLDIADTLLSDLLPSAPKTFGIDTHLYGLYSDAEDAMTQAQHITEACGWADNLKTSNAVMPTYVGEWSAATNICVNPDGSTTGGTSCSVAGCQCQSANFDDWNENMIEAVRKYVEAQMDVFERSSSGYFMWAAKGPGGWGFLNGIQKGVVPNPVTSRKYGSQCGGGARREVRGSLGLAGESW